MKIVIVEDHPMTRKGLCDALNAEADMEVCGESAAWQESVNIIQTVKPDVLLLDMHLADGDAWILLEQLKNIHQLPPTLILSVGDESLYARRFLKAGARGYLMKEEPIQDIIDALRKIHSGRIALSSRVESELFKQAIEAPMPTQNTNNDNAVLSDRELQIFSLYGRNLCAKEIGAMLNISDKSVSTYKTRIMKKLNLKTTPELKAAARAFRSGE